MAGSSRIADSLDGPGTTRTINTTIDSDQPIMTPQDIEQLFESGQQQDLSLRTSHPEDDEEDEIGLSDEEHSLRVGKLSQVLSTLQRLLDSESIELDAIAQKIGDGGRNGTSMLYIIISSSLQTRGTLPERVRFVRGAHGD
jgi:hypothetical protein